MIILAMGKHSVNLPKISQKEFLQQLKNKPFEDILTINTVESILKKNGGLFHMPHRDSPVILLISGGLDSIVCWDILMSKFGLKVYPLSLNRGLSRNKAEKKSVKFFSRYYKKKYPLLFNQPRYLDAPLSQLNININQVHQIMHPQAILDNFVSKPKVTANIAMGSASLYPILAKLYSQYLKYTQNINIHTIFCGFLASDGGIPEESFTSLRVGTLYLRVTTSDNKWQYSSPCLEKELGYYLFKKDLIWWGHRHHLPLEKTWTCYQAKRLPCGQCISCFIRKEAFNKANVVDKTTYLPLTFRNLPIYIFLKTVKVKLLQLLKSLQ